MAAVTLVSGFAARTVKSGEKTSAGSDVVVTLSLVAVLGVAGLVTPLKVIVTCVDGAIDAPVNSEHSTSRPFGAPQLPTAVPATLIVPPAQPVNVVPLPNGI